MSLGFALSVAKEFHFGQVDKAGVDYFDGHIMSVLRNVQRLTSDVNTHIAAVLHDIVEDTDYTLEELSDSFGKEVALIVDLVTKKSDQKKKYYFRAIKAHKGATLVKLGDMYHNTDLTRLSVVTVADEVRTAQYIKWIEYLEK